MWLVFVFLLWLLTGGPGAGQTPEASPALPSPTPVPLAEIAAELELAQTRRGELEARLLPGSEAARMALPNLRRELQRLKRKSAEHPEADPNLDTIRELEADLTALLTELKSRQTALTQAAALLEADIRGLEDLRLVWTKTLEVTRNEELPATLRSRLEVFPPQLKAAQELVQSRRSDVLELQAQVSELEGRARESLAALSLMRAAAVDRIFLQDGAPLWSLRAYDQGAHILQPLLAALAEQGRSATEYLAVHIGNLALHLLLGALLTAALFQVRARVEGRIEREPALARPLAVFQAPWTMTLVLSLLFLDELYPDAPRLLHACLVTLAIVPAGRLLARLLDGRARTLLTFLVVNFMIDQARNLMEPVPLLARLVFLLQMVGCALFLSAFILMNRSQRKVGTPLRLACWAALAAFSGAALANLAGFVSLSLVAGETALDAGYVALILSALLNIADALVMLALLVPPLGLLIFVKHHRLMLRRRVRLLLSLLLGGLWVAFGLDRLTLLDPGVAAARQLLAAGLNVGELHIQLGDLLTFALLMACATSVSRFARFVLEEDVYPRIDLPRGLPYTLSTMLHYAVLMGGFLLAMSALGLDVGRFAVLIGALGVGIGLGLQNIVNNFVSGIILLFERPVKVGDVVRVGTQTGELRSIGLRASVVRTWEGAEVIVPNGSLISQEVVNWSSVPARRLDIKVGVAYGTQPEQVLELLVRVAQEQPDVLAEPVPEALFLEFGDSALMFQLRASTEASDWPRVRSQLLLGLTRALAQAGIDIPFPHRTVVLRSEPNPTSKPTILAGARHDVSAFPQS